LWLPKSVFWVRSAQPRTERSAVNARVEVVFIQ
jgi:hypothetical protein